ncbi:hypothetical protein Purlil1_12896 [Purpureocillium lilacinum]|uniref:D-isomer specific 2-hydroxyacid dehydrogenase NAD-binding domain-containing protein n=1 Tax=Purpureocillium lilacinum TaxID=33203 RepID=A0ABR0BFK5_PURLI|nr:hypothetical protein Purlil1_12896 [Purpureocillium lilacinum]
MRRQQMLDATTYDELIAKVPTLMHGGRPIDACIVFVGVAHFQPFESKFLHLLLHSCRIVISIAAGCRSSAVERMKRNSAAHCNSTPPSNIPNRADEATLKLMITLVLTTLQSLLYARKDLHNETLRNNTALARDPPGTVLGIAGMGRIGKHVAQHAALHGVRVKYSDRRRLDIDDEAAYKAWYCHSVQELLWESDVVYSHRHWITAGYGETLLLLHQQQIGALPKRSAVDLVTALVHDIETALANGQVATLVTMDVQGAFDTVSVIDLSSDSGNNGWPLHLVRWAGSFMKDRSAAVQFHRPVIANKYPTLF